MLSLIKADRYGFTLLIQNEKLEFLLYQKYKTQKPKKGAVLLIIDSEEIKGPGNLIDKLYSNCPNPLSAERELSFCCVG